jgi:hypothetical protein
MPNPFDKIKLNGEQFETPVTIKQVETHLIFGPLSRHFPTAYVFFIGGLLSLIGGFFALQMPLGEYIGNIRFSFRSADPAQDDAPAAGHHWLADGQNFLGSSGLYDGNHWSRCQFSTAQSGRVAESFSWLDLDSRT